MVVQPGRSDHALVSEFHVWHGHFRPEALSVGQFGQRGVGEVFGGLHHRAVHIPLRRLDITLVGQPADYVADHFALPFQEGIRAQPADGGVQAGVVGRAAANVHIRVGDAPDDLARRELRQAFGGGERLQNIIEIFRLEGVESQRAQAKPGQFEKIAAGKRSFHEFTLWVKVEASIPANKGSVNRAVRKRLIAAPQF
ncbi:MAG: hypothetical protein HND47_20520 [Chloroflexi bacterium]|nr:hypothetical protein [Chloroflexota bacterium]